MQFHFSWVVCQTGDGRQRSLCTDHAPARAQGRSVSKLRGRLVNFGIICSVRGISETLDNETCSSAQQEDVVAEKNPTSGSSSAMPRPAVRSFCKMLTESSICSGAFSVERRHAEECLPPLVCMCGRIVDRITRHRCTAPSSFFSRLFCLISWVSYSVGWNYADLVWFRLAGYEPVTGAVGQGYPWQRVELAPHLSW